MRKHVLALMSVTYLLMGCNAEPNLSQSVDNKRQSSLGWNSLGWNSLGWNSLGWNSLGWNSLGWNSLGWNGLGWTGSGFSGMGITTDWGLDPWINEPGITMSDREDRFKGVAYWTGCACGTGDSLVWTGNNPFTPGVTETRTFQGAFDLAPTWCRGTGTVPLEEMQAVSACLFARMNTKGIHNPLSLRGVNSSLALGDNEKLFMAYPEGQFFGNIWDASDKIFDPTTSRYYKNLRAYSCIFPSGASSASLNRDLQIIVGRDCEWGNCSSHMKTLLQCSQSGSTDGSQSVAYIDPTLTMSLGSDSDPSVSYSGANASYANGYQDTITGSQFVEYRGNKYRQISVFLGAWADLETENWKDASYKCDDGCAPMDGCKCYDTYCRGGEQTQGEAVRCEAPSACNNCQTVVRSPGPKCGLSQACKGPDDCVRDRKLVALDAACWLPIQFTRPWDILSGSWVSGTANPHKAGTLLFRYSNGTPEELSIQIRDQIRNLPIPGTGFQPTGSWDNYDNKYIYPIYPGRTTFSPGTPGIEIAIAGDPASQFPHLDYAQIFVGPPLGVSPRELYWNTDPVDIDPNGVVCTKVRVEKDSDFRLASLVRVNLKLRDADPAALDVTLSHNGQKTAYLPSKDDASWSEWDETFAKDDPREDAWEVCVNGNGSSGRIEAVQLELSKP